MVSISYANTSAKIFKGLHWGLLHHCSFLFFPPIGRGCANKLLSYLLVWHLSSIFEMMAV